RQRAVQVVTLPLEHRLGPLHHLKEEISWRAAARAGLALARQLNVRAVLDARRDPDLHCPPGAHPAVAVALRAGAGQDGAVAAAVRAGLGGDHLAEEGLAHLADLAPPGADLAGLRVRAGRGALARAGRADHRGVHGELTGRAERALRQVEFDPDRRVPAAPRPAARAPARARARGAEDRVDELAEREAGRAAEPAAPGRARARGGGRGAAPGVHLAPFRVTKDPLGPRGLL